MGRDFVNNLYGFLYGIKIKSAVTSWVTADSLYLLAEREALSLGIPPNVVMKWTGHSDYKAMKPYIDIADSIKVNAMSRFD